MNMEHLRYLDTVAQEDLTRLRRKEATYQGSWKRRGGIGAFMMLARKWDRLEQMAKQNGYDIFKAIIHDEDPGVDGTILAEIQDLRCYLLLVEAEYKSFLGGNSNFEQSNEDYKPGTPADGGHHASADDSEAA